MVFKLIENKSRDNVHTVKFKSVSHICCRSRMNVVFRVGEGGKDDLEANFISQAAAQGLLSLKGHRYIKSLNVLNIYVKYTMQYIFLVYISL